jgi:hypothetical protein
MTKCPKCGKEINVKRNYKIASKTNTKGKTTEFTFGMCDDCSLVVILESHEPKVPS